MPNPDFEPRDVKPPMQATRERNEAFEREFAEGRGFAYRATNDRPHEEPPSPHVRFPSTGTARMHPGGYGPGPMPVGEELDGRDENWAYGPHNTGGPDTFDPVTGTHRGDGARPLTRLEQVRRDSAAYLADPHQAFAVSADRSAGPGASENDIEVY